MSIPDQARSALREGRITGQWAQILRARIDEWEQASADPPDAAGDPAGVSRDRGLGAAGRTGRMSDHVAGEYWNAPEARSLTLRDYFAAQALPMAWAIECERPTGPYSERMEPTYAGAAARAYHFADAMLAERAK